ncbi:Elongin-A like [Actinidia chinensis var. chinensis]|uniref:Elongin-A like n=1 Tax=Actinidia chinensis var. chinensis TaxID=1590841 RepID=A0A2R6QBX9_ACTCC|nr:Elongin-A like [Actinidia chinensis var. chinensis]
MMMRRKAPSLVDLCVQMAVDNVRYLGDLGETDLHLLDRILPHCTVDQLRHIEDSTEGRDLSPVTDKLWKNFYELQFGAKSANLVIDRMKKKKVSFKWKKLYEAKLKDLDECQQKSFDRIKELYKKEDALIEISMHLTHAGKQSRQVRLCTKVPPSSNKRSFYGGGPGGGISNTKSNIMKKAKVQFLNSHEMKNLAAMKKNGLQQSNGLSSIRKPGVFSGNNSASTSKPTGRRL